jgi:hypothetical protein
LSERRGDKPVETTNSFTPLAKNNNKTIKSIIKKYGWIFLIIALFIMQRLIAGTPHLVERIHVNFFRETVVGVMNFWTSMVPFSLTEFVFIVGGMFFIVSVFFVYLFKPVKTRFNINKTLPIVGWGLAGMYLIFMITHGFNYSREPAANHFNFTTKTVALSDLVEMGEWLISETNTIRETRGENEYGHFMPETSLNRILDEAYKGYEQAGVKYDVLAGKRVPRVKPVALSRFWSYSRTTGMYFPFFSEVNINTHIPSHEILETVLHEMAHSKGYAREDEANFVAFIAGVYHPDLDYTYSVFLQNTKRVLIRVSQEDEFSYIKLEEQLSDKVRSDLEVSRNYWKNYRTIVGSATLALNNLFLKANSEKNGIKSYGGVVDLIANWHSSHQGKYYVSEKNR